ncbi:macrophage mannose receptor 1 isoform X1 [Salmo salar]|uniref:Macrophage mannose receptor 1 isoform X1 n=1 Tax=Salmo salar TaxID=8030 RepID=A0ABM3EFL7_SALSA|nr:macrophage mannose receptor 1-like isoform X1 [Salmo salar]
MGHSLFLLFFSGLSVLPSCLSHQFHFVNISKNWTEAQSYCRQNYTDLASIDDMAEMNRLNNTVKAGLLTEPAWIGLYNTSWRWSLGDTELGTVVFWDKKHGEINDQPDNVKNNEFCVFMRNGSWHDENCSTQHNFVCYDTNLTSMYILITEKKTWSEAQHYCRQNHTDLASVRNGADNNAIQKAIHNVIQEEVWIGLYREWRWSDQSGSTFRNWMTGEPNGAVVVGGDHPKLCVEIKFPSGEWNDEPSTTNHPFICYDDKLVLVSENKTWSEALWYCREQDMELVSAHNHRIQHWVQQRAKKASSPYVWLGLRYTCTLDFWFWVNGEESCFHNWADGEGYSTRKEQRGNTGAIERNGGKWVGLPETDKFNFICSKSDDY